MKVPFDGIMPVNLVRVSKDELLSYSIIDQLERYLYNECKERFSDIECKRILLSVRQIVSENFDVKHGIHKTPIEVLEKHVHRYYPEEEGLPENEGLQLSTGERA